MKETFVVEPLMITKYTEDSFLCNMYVLMTQESLRDGNALVIDTIQSEEVLKDLNRADIRNLTIILTHEHFDHTTGINWLRENFEVHLISHEVCAKKILLPRNNRSLSIMGSDEDSRKYRYYPPYSCTTDETFCGDTSIQWCGLDVKIVYAPGHTAGSCCININTCMFVGDSALLGLPTLTRLPGGSQKDYNSMTLPFLKNLNLETVIFPGHGNVYKMAEVTYRGDCFQYIPDLKEEL